MPIIWINENQKITTISYTPRDQGTFGGYDVDEIPESMTHYGPAKGFYIADETTEDGGEDELAE